MEETKNASISVNLSNRSIDISGTEEFVEKNMAKVFDFLEKNSHAELQVPSNKEVTNLTEALDSPAPKTLADVDIKDLNEAPKDKYIEAGVYHVDSEDGSISILKNIPGNNKTEKTKNIALIVLHIKGGKVPGKELIPICEKHACYDGPNFSKTFNREKTNIIRKGSGQTWTIELTQPGETAAVALLEEMANDKK